MSYNTLYIIGNGFDLYHGLKSSYYDFKDYLKENDPNLLEHLEKYFGNESLWSEFEETLAYLDTEQIADECSIYLESYGSDDWSDAYHHNYQYEVQKRIDIITANLKESFTEWILQLKFPNNDLQSKIGLKRDSIFLNFNYTDTLEKLYGISKENIFYIHNKAIDLNSTLILGHSRELQKNKRQMVDDEDSDIRITEANEILDNFFIETYKSSEKIINENEAFFKNLSSLKEIFVLGHSLSDVDKKYFEAIVGSIDQEIVNWKIGVYNKGDISHHSDFMTKLGINLELVEWDNIKYLGQNQPTLFPLDKN